MKKFVVMSMSLMLLVGLVGAVWASEPGKLTIWADANRAPVLVEISKEFSAEYGIPVEVQELDFGTIRDKFGVAGPAGEGADIIIGPHDWIGQLMADGLLEPILFLEDISDQFVPVGLEAFSSGGKIYGLPCATEAIGIVYNKDLVSVPPKTYSEFLNVARALTDPEKSQYGFLSNIPGGPDPYHSFPFITAFGGYIFGLDEEGVLDPTDIGLDNEGAIKGGHLILDLVKEGILPAGTDYGAMTGLFNEGKVGMILAGPWVLPGAKAAEINYGIAKLPTIAGQTMRPFVGVQGFMVNAFSENKPLAMTFLQDFVTTKETMLAIYEKEPRNPAFLPALEEVSVNPDVATWSASAADGVPMPSIPEMSAVWDAWADALSLIVNEEMSPEDALHDAVARIRELIGS